MVCSNFQRFLQNSAGFTDTQFKNLLPYLELEEIPKDKIIETRAGTDGNLFFVDRGLLRFYSIDTMGKERVLQFAPENWFIGDRSNLYNIDSNSPLYVYHINAIEDSIVVRLNKDFGEKLAQIEPNFVAIHERLLQKHILHLQHRINLLIGSSVKERYEDFIRMYPDLLQRVPQWMIASYLGVTPEGLSRVRSAIAKGL